MTSIRYELVLKKKFDLFANLRFRWNQPPLVLLILHLNQLNCKKNPKLISQSGAILLAATDWGSLHNQISTTHTHSPNLEGITRLFTIPCVPFDSV